MNIIKCVIRGQALTVLTPLMADLTVNYFNVEADFSREWDNGPYGVLTKHVHIHRKDNHNIGSDWSLDSDNKLESTNGINLSAGTWEIWFSSAIVDGSTGETLWRLTTEVKTFEVLESGTGGGYMPDIPESNVDQITAIAQDALDIAQSVRDDADAGEFDGAPGQPGPQGPPGNYTKPETGIPKSDLASSVQESLEKADTALQQHNLEPYRTAAAQDVIDEGKLGTSGDGSNVTATFTTASTRANIATGEKLSVIFGKIAKWFSDLGTAAFKNFTSNITQGSTDLITSGAVHTGLAGKANSDLGITGASVGDLVQIKTVSSGKPTAFEKISNPNGNIAIVQNTNTATQNIARYQYVIWKGSLYIASAAIASGATLSSSNLTAVDVGGLNALAYFTPGQRYTYGFIGSGFVSDSGKSLTLNATSGKKVLGTPTIESLKIIARGINGYVDIFNYSLPEVVGNTDFTISTTSGTNFIEVKILKSTALTNATNNTPVTVNGQITFIA